MSLIRCLRTARKIGDEAHPEYDVSYYLTPGWDRVPDRCYISVRNKSILGIARREGLREWEADVLSAGKIGVNMDLYGQIPTINKEDMIRRIEACGGEVTGVHDERMLTGKERPGLRRIAHVHFRADPRSARCLIRKLLEEP